MSIGERRDWQCSECGASGSAPCGQPMWLVECDDCGEGEVEWVNEDLEERGFSLRIDRDSPLDAPSTISKLATSRR